MSKTFAATRATVAHQPLATAPARAARWRVATWLVLLALCMLGVAAQASGEQQDKPQNKQKRPNILFVIMDDVGIDQMKKFGYGGARPPPTPTIDTLADGGIMFRNNWSMPACSTSRAVFFTGRFPLRTNVYGALGPNDLANAQVSPYEVTLPRLLKQQGYQSALFGKFHIGLQGNNPFRYGMPKALGWDYFYGWLDETGDPSSIDTTAGGVGPIIVSTGKGPYSCGFVPGAAEGGANFGACYAGDGSCRNIARQGGVPPGRACRDNGGIFAKNEHCQREAPVDIRRGFHNLSAHYVSPLVINDENGVTRVPPRDIRARTYRGTAPVDAAIDWIQQQPKHRPWMATVSFASAHTPVMQPPQALVTADAAAVSRLGCDSSNNLEQRALTNLMIEALDTELGRLLVSTGLARRDRDGRLEYNPHRTDTMIVILGDNGTLGATVKPPFDTSRAKGTAYQTGVWVPLVVAGPLVRQPNRSVGHMTNIADLFQFFGEIAGIDDVQARVPRKLDSVAMLPYLKHPEQDSLRSWNFTQVGPNAQADRGLNSPCTIQSTCTQIPVSKSVCEDNNGTWWGRDADAPETHGIGRDGFRYCCEVNLFRNTMHLSMFTLQPLRSVAIRNDTYKVVRNNFIGNPNPSQDDPPNCEPQVTDEFYAINEEAPVPKLDRARRDLMQLPRLTPEMKANYDKLTVQLIEVLRSQPPCRGDGNIDGLVNEHDKTGWAQFAALSLGNSSWFDINLDGLTNGADLDIIQRRQGTTCRE